MVVLHLPFPPSTNRLTRHGVRGGKLVSYTNPDYASWRDEAAAMYQQQKRNAGSPVKGAFSYHLTLDETRWPKAGDGDNRMKAPLDFMQAMGLIEDDKYAAAGGWTWGPVSGCTIQVNPVTHARIKVGTSRGRKSKTTSISDGS